MQADLWSFGWPLKVAAHSPDDPRAANEWPGSVARPRPSVRP